MSRSRNLDFDAEHNVFILELSPKERKGTGTQIWTYRYRKAAPEKRPARRPTSRSPPRQGKRCSPGTPLPTRRLIVSTAARGRKRGVKLEKIAEVSEPGFADRDLATDKVYHYTIRRGR
jgi:hypothetical protein